jgi:hypothetical protein
MPMPRRAVAFGGLCALCLAVAVGAVGAAVARPLATLPAIGGSIPSALSDGRPAESTPILDPSSSRLVFRQVDSARPTRQVAVAPLASAERSPTGTGLECDRVHSAAKVGICLGVQPGLVGPSYRATLFDADFRPIRSMALAGLPSRARVSPDGRYAATTVFVTGDSYSAMGFSTRTTIFDTTDGTAVADLEEIPVLRDGVPFKEADFNFWGVTFAADGDRFYATLATGKSKFLVEGSVAARRMSVLRDGVECPSLSPDGTRIAFKQLAREGGWRVHVLDLDTLIDRRLSEERSVDDQVEWLDDDHVLYGIRVIEPPDIDSTDVWALPLDGGPPRLFAPRAFSPAVVRPG